MVMLTVDRISREFRLWQSVDRFILRVLIIGNRRATLRAITLLIVSAAGFGASFETGVVAASDGAAHFTNAYPVIVRIAGGRLVTAFSVTPKDNPDGYIAASTSDDGAKPGLPQSRRLMSQANSTRIPACFGTAGACTFTRPPCRPSKL